MGAWREAAGATLTFPGLPAVALGDGRPLPVARGESLPSPIILAGREPYLAFDPLYDAERQLIGLRPRR